MTHTSVASQVLHPQSMRPARQGNIPVRVKNSYNPGAPGTLITRERDMSTVYPLAVLLGAHKLMQWDEMGTVEWRVFYRF